MGTADLRIFADKMNSVFAVVSLLGCIEAALGAVLPLAGHHGLLGHGLLGHYVGHPSQLGGLRSVGPYGVAAGYNNAARQEFVNKVAEEAGASSGTASDDGVPGTGKNFGYSAHLLGHPGFVHHGLAHHGLAFGHAGLAHHGLFHHGGVAVGHKGVALGAHHGFAHGFGLSPFLGVHGVKYGEVK